MTMEEEKQKPYNYFTVVCCIIACTTSLLLGYDIGVMSGAELFIQEDMKISNTKVEILTGILNIFALVGSVLAGPTSDRIGRRYTMAIAAAIFFTGSILMGFAIDYTFLMAGRFVAGIGVGFAIMVAPVYVAELSPTSTRGFLASFPEIFIAFGQLLGYVSNYVFSKLPVNLGWRLMLSAGVVPAVFLAAGTLAMPESPRWLVMQGRLGEAQSVLAKSSNSLEEAELRFVSIKQAAGNPNPSGSGVWKELLLRPTKQVRRIIIAAVGIHFFQQTTGIDSIVLYSPRIFQMAGIHRKSDVIALTIGIGGIKVLFVFVATLLLDRSGRRPLLLAGTGGVITSLTTLGFGLTMIYRHPERKLKWAVGLCIAAVMSQIASFSTGPGTIAWVYSAEIFPLRLRAKGLSIAVAVNRATSAAVAMSFISLYEAITIGGAFFLFAGIQLVAWVFYFFFLPETRGLALEDTEGLFKKTRNEHVSNKVNAQAS